MLIAQTEKAGRPWALRTHGPPSHGRDGGPASWLRAPRPTSFQPGSTTGPWWRGWLRRLPSQRSAGRGAGSTPQPRPLSDRFRPRPGRGRGPPPLLVRLFLCWPGAEASGRWPWSPGLDAVRGAGKAAPAPTRPGSVPEQKGLFPGARRDVPCAWQSDILMGRVRLSAAKCRGVGASVGGGSLLGVRGLSCDSVRFCRLCRRRARRCHSPNASHHPPVRPLALVAISWPGGPEL